MRLRVLLVTLLLTGCANVTTTKVHRTVAGDLVIDSGKDVKIGALEFHDGPISLVLKNYSSAANTDAIDAQGNREVNLTNAVADAVLKAVAAGAGAIKP